MSASDKIKNVNDPEIERLLEDLRKAEIKLDQFAFFKPGLQQGFISIEEVMKLVHDQIDGKLSSRVLFFKINALNTRAKSRINARNKVNDASITTKTDSEKAGDKENSDEVGPSVDPAPELDPDVKQPSQPDPGEFKEVTRRDSPSEDTSEGEPEIENSASAEIPLLKDQGIEAADIHKINELLKGDAIPKDAAFELQTKWINKEITKEDLIAEVDILKAKAVEDAKAGDKTGKSGKSAPVVTAVTDQTPKEEIPQVPKPQKSPKLDLRDKEIMRWLGELGCVVDKGNVRYPLDCKAKPELKELFNYFNEGWLTKDEFRKFLKSLATESSNLPNWYNRLKEFKPGGAKYNPPPPPRFTNEQLAAVRVEISPESRESDVPLSISMKSGTEDIVVRYTLNNSEPTIASNEYKAPFTISKTRTIRARGFYENTPVGGETTQKYNFNLGEVEFSPPPGTHNPPVTVTLSSGTADAIIRYTIDGSEPNETSVLYDQQERIFMEKGESDREVTIQAKAFHPDMKTGPVSTAIYFLKSPQWVELEPDPSETDRPENDISGYQILNDDWAIVYASIRGKSHALGAKFREDSCTWDRIGDWTLFAVSDGAGSARLSRVGSRIACEKSVESLKNSLKDFKFAETDEDKPQNEDFEKLILIISGAAQDALKAIQKEAKFRSCPANDLAATLLVSVHTSWKRKDLVGSIQVGDGAIALYVEKGTMVLLGTAEHGEHAGETSFITSKKDENEFKKNVIFSVKDSIKSLALMTDGVSDDFYPEDKRLVLLFDGSSLPNTASKTGKPVDGLAASVFPNDDPDAALLEWIKYEKKSSFDDRTLLTMFRRNQSWLS